MRSRGNSNSKTTQRRIGPTISCSCVLSPVSELPLLLALPSLVPLSGHRPLQSPNSTSLLNQDEDPPFFWERHHRSMHHVTNIELCYPRRCSSKAPSHQSSVVAAFKRNNIIQSRWSYSSVEEYRPFSECISGNWFILQILSCTRKFFHGIDTCLYCRYHSTDYG